MQPVKLVKASIQFGFGNHRNIFIFFVARFVVHQPHHAAPEPVRPPIDPVRQRAGGIRGGTIVMRPVYRCVRDLKPRFSLTQAILAVIFAIKAFIHCCSSLLNTDHNLLSVRKLMI